MGEKGDRNDVLLNQITQSKALIEKMLSYEEKFTHISPWFKGWALANNKEDIPPEYVYQANKSRMSLLKILANKF